MSATHPAAQLLQALFSSAWPDQFVEIRPLSENGVSPRRGFAPVGALRLQGFHTVVPFDLAGRANVYFGVLPRSRRGGRAADVAVATCLWVDLDRGIPEPWPEAVPAPSIVVETSPGKCQLYWLLDQPTADLDSVECLNRRLAQALGGDKAATDRARVLRLTGFPNLKYADRPLARLVELNEERRYQFPDLEAALPPLLSEPRACPRTTTGRIGESGRFDAHKGGSDAPQAVLDEVARELRRRGATTYDDGRLAGRCPFPGHTGQSAHNFYWSPISGGWHCFGEHHAGRQADKPCVAGGIWRLWAVLFPGRRTPRGVELSTSPPSSRSTVLGDVSNSRRGPYEPPVPAPLEALRDAPQRKRTAELLRSVGEGKKAAAEATCGVPIKGKCPTHGIVREGRATGKTPWCVGCNTETSAKYLNTAFPDGSYAILRLQRHLGPQDYDAAELRKGEWEMAPSDGDRLAALVEGQYQAATGHFRRVQRRYKDECLGWHFAVGHGQDGLWVELQVLVRHSDQLGRVLLELTGDTRKAALFAPDAVVRYDYPVQQHEHLRRDWAGLLKCALLRLDDDLLFGPIFFALKGKQLSLAYGELHGVLKEGREETRAQQEGVQKCPVVEADGRTCGQKLTFILDPENKLPLSPLAPGSPWAVAVR